MNFNYFESEYYKILLYKNKFPDKFLINMNINNIIIERIDAKIGWGQDLHLVVRNKVNQNETIIKVGPCNQNIINVNYEDNSENLDNIKNHYENDQYKIFYISQLHNDIFNLDYNEKLKILTIKRVDYNDGWGQDLKLKYVDKNTKKEKIIHVGKSISNIVYLRIDFNKLDYVDVPNFYESSNFKINIYDNKNPDLFEILFYEDNNTIYVKRLDSELGWGQLLILNLYDIKNDNNYIIYIGSSIKNEIYKKIDLKIKKTYIALTTIPSRIKQPIFIENLKDLIENQQDKIENIFITIPYKYKRFTETIPDEIIDQLMIMPKVIIIRTEEDYGPASKYLGPLIHHYKEVKDNILIIIDDDRKYNKNLVRNFNIAFDSFPNTTFSSGLWSEYFNKDYKKMDDNYLELNLYKEENNNKFHNGQGLGGFYGFAIYVKNIEKFINYNLYILNRIPKSFFHDEGIIIGYLKYKEETILYLKHVGCNFIDSELSDALCNSNLVNRNLVEKEILQITNLEKII